MAVSDTDSAESNRGEEGPGTRRGECQSQDRASGTAGPERCCEDRTPWMAMATKAVPGLRDLQGPLALLGGGAGGDGAALQVQQ